MEKKLPPISKEPELSPIFANVIHIVAMPNKLSWKVWIVKRGRGFFFLKLRLKGKGKSSIYTQKTPLIQKNYRKIKKSAEIFVISHCTMVNEADNMWVKLWSQRMQSLTSPFLSRQFIFRNYQQHKLGRCFVFPWRLFFLFAIDSNNVGKCPLIWWPCTWHKLSFFQYQRMCKPASVCWRR